MGKREGEKKKKNGSGERGRERDRERERERERERVSNWPGGRVLCLPYPISQDKKGKRGGVRCMPEGKVMSHRYLTHVHAE